METVLPPGESPLDPANRDIDRLPSRWGDLQTCLIWIDEHLTSFRAERYSDPNNAENELKYAELCTTDARTSMQRVLELVLSGYTIDLAKRFPREFRGPEIAT